ncbi:gliding motility-associated-like protein [Lewinella aquimaris]|uniref:Gliding motility-associated-like protein n=1 Tax=Neolewinella aquimaris TaxID=1835722 RepID=A0A840E916_9BACT|nr:gliding motility-associated C-terminal domain-containing protein [Neolewinella aquimaris]MBB4080212.1 gliding motility-associated-like protein [Neolewinella aquimaris]
MRFPLQLQENNIIISEGSTGDVIFYSDGQRVIDGSHRIMPNGSGLGGTPSNMYGTSVVYDPAGCRSYYLFYGEDETIAPPRTLFYTKIDLDLPGNGSAAEPLGDVVVGQKNIELVGTDVNLTEGIFAMPKDDISKESWLFVGQRIGNKILQFEVTAAGVSLFATHDLAEFFPGNLRAGDPISKTRFAYYKDNDQEGRLVIAVANKEDGSECPMGYIRFKPSTGEFLDPVPTLIGNDMEWTYGLAFSPDGSKLYYSDYFQKRLRQFDFVTGKLATVSTSPHNGRSGGLLLGPDGKIYWANVFVNFNRSPITGLARINAPNETADRCEVQYEAYTFPTNSRPSLLGALPTFGSFPESVTGQQTRAATCSDENGQGVAEVSGDPSTYTFAWDNGERTQRADSLSGGNHQVTVTDITGCAQVVTVVVEQTEEIDPQSFAVSVQDESACTNVSDGALIITHPSFLAGRSYQFSYQVDGQVRSRQAEVNNSRALRIDGLDAGDYEFLSVSADTGCSGDIDGSFVIGEGNTLAVPEIVRSGSSCIGSTLELSAPAADTQAVFYWTGPAEFTSSSPRVTITPVSTTTFGTYTLRISRGDCQSETADIEVTAESPPQVIGGDTLVCGTEVILPQTLPQASLVWADIATAGARVVEESGTYPFTLTSDNGCTTTDSFVVILAESPVIDLPESFSVAECTVVQLNTGISDSTRFDFSWTGDFDLCEDCANPSVFVAQSGPVYLQVVDMETGCLSTDSTSILITSSQVIYIPNAFSPNGDGVNDAFTVFSRKANTTVKSIDIYDRWGDHVFHDEEFPANDPAVGWRGQAAGAEESEMMNNEVFVYHLAIRLSDGTEIQRSGLVHLVL